MKARWGAFRARAAGAAAVALVVATVSLAADARAATSGSVFEVAPVVAEIKRQLAAAEAGGAGLRIEDAQLDLGLVENPGGRAGLVVPGADFVAGSKEETPRPALKRRIVIEVQPATKAPAEAMAASPAGGGSGRLAQAINELRAGVQQAIAADPAYELKKFTIDLDFALERDGKGAVQLVLFAREKRIEPMNVHGLKLRLAAKDAAKKEKEPNKM